MTFLKSMLTDLWNGLGRATWVEIRTKTPACTYYFGPFLTVQEAEALKPTYVADLEAEGAQGIQVTLKQCHTPDQLTIEHS
jgi:hypothetical protein